MKLVSKTMLGLFLLSLIACEPAEDATTAHGDAFITVTSAGQDTLYGLSLYAYANKNFQSVTASPSEVTDVSYTLGKRFYQNTFSYETPEENYGTLAPQIGEYNFAALMQNGDNIAFSDVLTEDVIYPAEVTKLEYNETDKRIDIEWVKNTDADLYVVFLLNENDEYAFASANIKNDATSYSVRASTSGWATGMSPTTGDKYTVRLEAFLYESSKTDLNLQCKSVYKQEITWGSSN